MLISQELKYNLKKWQDGFIFSKTRYPAMWSSWATGKSMSLIFRAMLYSELIPNNLGIIFRKEYTDLRDSTIKDFERYTGLTINSSREVVLPNGSVIMFRHIEELNNIQNVNLGWFAIEQGDELASSGEFFLLFGRLRRELSPTEEFLKLGIAVRSGFVIGNAGDHWGKELWKDGKLEDAEFFEANTLDNVDVLPDDFIKSLEVLKKQRPEMYAQYVMNDWSVTADRYILIKPSEIAALENIYYQLPRTKHLTTCDPALGGDECVIYQLENTEIIDTLIIHHKDEMKVAGELLFFMNKHKCDDLVIDSIGIGGGIASRLNEQEKRVQRINSAESSSSDKWLNKRAEMWWFVSQEIQAGRCAWPNDEVLRKQLSSVRYEVINSNGCIKMEHKPNVKKRLGSSPDRADAFVYGIWGLQYVDYISVNKMKARSQVYEFNPATV